MWTCDLGSKDPLRRVRVPLWAFTPLHSLEHPLLPRVADRHRRMWWRFAVGIGERRVLGICMAAERQTSLSNVRSREARRCRSNTRSMSDHRSLVAYVLQGDVAQACGVWGAGRTDGTAYAHSPRDPQWLLKLPKLGIYKRHNVPFPTMILSKSPWFNFCVLGRCHTWFLCQNQVLILCITQDQLFHTYGPKVFTDNQMSRIKYNYYINNVSKDYDDSQWSEIVEDSITPQERQLGQHIA
jgi:hypothetical protein